MLDVTRLALFVLSTTSRGNRLHHAALEAMNERRWADAEFLFEAGARRYRREVQVQALARLRVHQLMARVFATGDGGLETGRCLEVERRLCQLDRIESLSPPFELVDAHSLLACWLDDAPGADSAADEASYSTDLPLSRAA